MAKPKPPQKLETLIQDESKPFWDAINKEDDLACVLISVAYLEQCLGSLLSRFFINEPKITDTLFDPTRGGQLAAFSSKTHLAYCLGLIPKTIYKNLLLLAKIRNYFAHSHLAAKFTNTDIKDDLSKLHIPKNMMLKSVDYSGRNRFQTCAVMASSIIQVHALSVTHREILKWGGID